MPTNPAASQGLSTADPMDVNSLMEDEEAGNWFGDVDNIFQSTMGGEQTDDEVHDDGEI